MLISAAEEFVQLPQDINEMIERRVNKINVKYASYFKQLELQHQARIAMLFGPLHKQKREQLEKQHEQAIRQLRESHHQDIDQLTKRVKETIEQTVHSFVQELNQEQARPASR